MKEEGFGLQQVQSIGIHILCRFCGQQLFFKIQSIFWIQNQLTLLQIQVYMHIEHIEYATASTILYEVNNICMFLVARMSHFFMFTIRVLMLFLCYIYLMLCPCCLHFPLSSGILLPLQVQFIKMNEKGKRAAARSSGNHRQLGYSPILTLHSF